MTRKVGKERLDRLLVARGLAETRARAQAYIMAGEVRVDGEVVNKAGTSVPLDVDLHVDRGMPFVGRGGFKLAGALDSFAIPVAGHVCADVGACTGGFTDVLLQRGAARVHAIDVGYGQLDWKLRSDPRVNVLERTNARYLETLGEPVDLVVIDVSFISLTLILPAVRQWLAPQFDIVALIKPQFEAGRAQVGKGGIVKDPAVHSAVVRDVLTWAAAHALHPAGVVRSSIEGSDGNVEFLAWLRDRPADDFDLAATLAAVVADAADDD